ncbi:hypothetical protein PPYR_12101 [Photinus pyralis]|uniref:Calreticulin n=2 Tax=Photinus pyralis TaxID=7054 RepID=A0A5N4AD72_PHOPY|nr:calreticulin-like [Photinus pyralis]KAB0795262.1 hypothetical protein PPYR_12101 [Photinus pyralis]
MRRYFLISAVLCLLHVCSAKVYFEEKFLDDSWEKNWIYSEHPDKEFGKFILSAGKVYVDEKLNKGLKTSEDAKFYALSRKFKAFKVEGKDLVIQLSVKHEQNIDCGGGYLKVFDCNLNQKDMHGESPYLLMFGPDICGGSKKVHAIINYDNKNNLIKKEIECKSDVLTHFYTWVIKPDNTYEVLIDGEKVESGELEEDWELIPPKKIKDPAVSKPEDWVDEAQIPDPNDTKPEDWDQPADIVDMKATKPDDWDDEMDGEWERPIIANPDYKGEWSPKQIDNPDYKGEWVHPEIDNPEYAPNPNLYKRGEICAVGLDLWQVKSGTIFDDILITDDLEYAKAAMSLLKELNEKETEVKEAEEKAAAEKAEAEKEAAEKEAAETEAAEKGEGGDAEASPAPAEQEPERDEL